MKQIVIGLGHKARRGKDTVAKTIIETFGAQYDIRRYAFADELKKEVNEAAEKAGGMLALFLQMYSQLPEWVVYDKTPDMTDPLCQLGKQRTLLQWWGSELRRAKDPFYWVKKVKAAIERDKPQVAIITDVRFPNEFMFVKSLDGYMVKVDREGYVDLDTNPAHHSEQQLANAIFDYEITAKEGDLPELKRCAVELFETLLRDQDITDEVENVKKELDSIAATY